MIGFHGAEGAGAWRGFTPGWVPVLAVVAAASMVLGNLAAIVQTSVRRLLAYSAIAHAGYILLGMLSHGGDALASVVFYVVTYGLTTVGAFGVVSIVQDQAGGDGLTNFAGLSKRAPILSFCMMVFMLSLAGIPPLAGFFGKFYLFTAALKASPENLGYVWLVLAAIALSAVSLYYYLQVLKQIYVAPAVEGSTMQIPVLSKVTLVVLAGAVLVLGCAPNLLLGRLVSAIQVAGF
jgi:NADH-quinone oxidoreductase subunit N